MEHFKISNKTKDRERQRKKAHRAAYDCYLADVVRQPGSVLTGAFGQAIYEEMRWTIGGGDQQETMGVPLRHARLINLLDTSWHLMHRTVDMLSMVRRAPASIEAGPGWEALRASSRFDAVTKQATDMAIAIDCACVRVSYREGRDPVVTLVPPHLVTVYCDPIDSETPLIVLEDRDREVHVWDISGDEPVYSVHPSMGAWESWRQMSTGMCLSEHRGGDYPWWWGDLPILPWGFYRAKQGSDYLSASPSKTRDTIDIILRRTELAYAQRVTMIGRAVFSSTGEISGWEQASNDIVSVLTLRSDTDITVDVIPDSAESVQKAWESLRDRMDLILSRYDRNLSVKKSEAAKSGAAIELELSGLYQARIEQEGWNREGDLALIRALISTRNYMVSAGLLPTGTILAEGDITVTYPLVWSRSEKEAQAAQIRADIRDGLASPVDLYLFDHGLDRNFENVKKAKEHLKQIEREANKQYEEEVALPDAPSEAAVAPDDALNGAQVASAIDIVTRVAAGTLPRDSAIAMLQLFFSLSEDSAIQIMGSMGTPQQTVVVPPTEVG